MLVLQTLVRGYLYVWLAPATSRCAEVRFKEHGLESIEVIDNGSGIASKDYDVVGKSSSSSLMTRTVLTILFSSQTLHLEIGII